MFHNQYFGYQKGIRFPDLDSGRAKADAQDAQYRVRVLEEQLEQTMLGLAAFWALVSDRLQITEENLIEKMTEIDLKDGVQDGRLKKHPVTCSHCQKTVSSKYIKCFYCGAELKKSPF